FILAGFLWGIPYLFIRVAVDSDNGFSPAIVVFGRVFIGALILIPIAIYDKSFFTAIKGWKYIAVYALFEMVGPWILIGTAEQKISSGLAGLLVSSVPIFSTLIASWHGDKSVWQTRRIVGIVIGFLGVFLLVGIESFTGSSDPLSILMILAASLGYAFAVIYITRKMPGVSGVAINGIAMAMTAVFYSPALFFLWPDRAVSHNAIYSLIALGVFSTGIAFAIFFTVMAEIGPTRASLVTYMNTAFAVVLGVIVLNEPLTVGILVGLPLVLIGSYLASRKSNA
ncbi:MAG: EamA family transporter, partial [Actinobacteria bacterium]|nr:EamA family transporter [Actinomycetota bacterium]